MSKVIEKLGKIFGSPARVKILRLFLFNPETPYDPAEISERSNVSRSEARREAESLLHAGLLKKRQYIKEIKSRKAIKRKKAKGYVLDVEFSMNEPLKTLLIESELVRVDDLPNRFRHAGKIALFVASGIFMRDKDRQLDILIVGNRLRRPSVDRAVKMLESEIGKEIRYAVFDLEEFTYRLRMYDKLIRDVFDYPHRRLIQKIDIGEK